MKQRQTNFDIIMPERYSNIYTSKFQQLPMYKEERHWHNRTQSACNTSNLENIIKVVS